MNDQSTAPGPYDTRNLRFRKAYIRDRLASLRQERDALVAERDQIDRQQRDAVRSGPSGAQPSTT